MYCLEDGLPVAEHTVVGLHHLMTLRWNSLVSDTLSSDSTSLDFYFLDLFLADTPTVGCIAVVLLYFWPWLWL